MTRAEKLPEWIACCIVGAFGCGNKRVELIIAFRVVTKDYLVRIVGGRSVCKPFTEVAIDFSELFAVIDYCAYNVSEVENIE